VLKEIEMKSVVFSNVSKMYKQISAVKELSFEVERGSIFGLLGPNGAGKTTAIRMILDILAPDSGQVLILGDRPSSKLKRRIGYLPEERGLYRDLKIREMLLFFCTLRGIEPGRGRRLVDEWLARVQLSECKEMKPSELSKGMAQKVQFIISALHEPELLILDEPFSGFDPVSVKLLQGVVFELKERGTTVVFSTHQMEQVEQMCEEICLINQGAKVLGGNLAEIKRGFGMSKVILQYRGTDSFLGNGLVKGVTRRPTCVEVHLNEGADGQELLTRAISAGARVERFEVVETSLNDIFISMVEGSK
jgi:ABC-2 type transport system ATP-binding protein